MRCCCLSAYPPMFAQDGDFDNAYATLFDAFQYFQNVGSDTRVPCLKYMLIANMLKEVRASTHCARRAAAAKADAGLAGEEGGG